MQFHAMLHILAFLGVKMCEVTQKLGTYNSSNSVKIDPISNLFEFLMMRSNTLTC